MVSPCYDRPSETFFPLGRSGNKGDTIRTAFLSLVLFVLLPIIAWGEESAADEPTFGPCVVKYSEPVITLTSAVNATFSAPISDVTFTNITFNGVPADLRALTALSSNVQVVDDTLQCKVPCGFSTDEGRYEMTVLAPGYQPSILSFTAKYSSFVGGCPATFSGTQRVSVTLQPQASSLNR
ncbi:MAG: hypothetical protein HY282_02370 [Nitrospirae bacterium]|nr:hypothetical protein [Candidatus Manganitrophaceae bacterium]